MKKKTKKKENQKNDRHVASLVSPKLETSLGRHQAQPRCLPNDRNTFYIICRVWTDLSWTVSLVVRWCRCTSDVTMEQTACHRSLHQNATFWRKSQIRPITVNHISPLPLASYIRKNHASEEPRALRKYEFRKYFRAVWSSLGTRMETFA